MISAESIRFQASQYSVDKNRRATPLPSARLGTAGIRVVPALKGVSGPAPQETSSARRGPAATGYCGVRVVPREKGGLGCVPGCTREGGAAAGDSG
jgi:hypothetical protein